MKFFSVVFVLGLLDACLGRSMQTETLKKRFNDAKYAFKFRIASKSTGECFQSSVATTTSATTTATTEPTTLQTQTTMATTTANKRQETTVAVAASTMTPTPDKTSEIPSTSASTVSTSDVPEITTGQNTFETSLFTDNPAEKTTLKTTMSSLTEQVGTTSSLSDEATQEPYTKSSTTYSTKLTKPTAFESNRIDLDSSTSNSLANSSESMEPFRKKRSCDWIVYHQDILIARKHIFKGCDKIIKMKRVKGMNAKYLKSTIRLQMDFSELRENRNYLFTGRAVPNQHSDDYVFMGDEMTVIEWKPSPFKSKKYLKSNRRGNCN